MFSFSGYGPDVRFLPVSCDVCGDATLEMQLSHFVRKLRRKTDITLDQVSVHLSSCIVTDNSHHARCPLVERIRSLLTTHGFTHITEGTYISARAQARRAAGEYSSPPLLEES